MLVIKGTETYCISNSYGRRGDAFFGVVFEPAGMVEREVRVTSLLCTQVSVSDLSKGRWLIYEKQ